VHPFIGRVDAHRTVPEQFAEASQIIHPGDVIGVSVSQNEEIHRRDIFTEALQTELWGRIHLHVQPVHDHVKRGARPVVAGIG
jgi:hypothetical protein